MLFRTRIVLVQYANAPRHPTGCSAAIEEQPATGQEKGRETRLRFLLCVVRDSLSSPVHCAAVRQKSFTAQTSASTIQQIRSDYLHSMSSTRKEPRTNKELATEFQGLTLAGLGVRTKTIAFINFYPYAVGMYIDVAAAERAFAGISSKEELITGAPSPRLP